MWRRPRARRSCSRVEVDANRRALAFYLEVGFVGTEPVAMEHGTAIRMRLDLHAPVNNM
jgi:hypothetical protein